jgi:hypothetical protein
MFLTRKDRARRLSECVLKEGSLGCLDQRPQDRMANVIWVLGGAASMHWILRHCEECFKKKETAYSAFVQHILLTANHPQATCSHADEPLLFSVSKGKQHIRLLPAHSAFVQHILLFANILLLVGCPNWSMRQESGHCGWVWQGQAVNA